MERELVRALGNDSDPVFSKQYLRVMVRKGLPEEATERRVTCQVGRGVDTTAPLLGLHL